MEQVFDDDGRICGVDVVGALLEEGTQRPHFGGEFNQGLPGAAKTIQKAVKLFTLTGPGMLMSARIMLVSGLTPVGYIMWPRKVARVAPMRVCTKKETTIICPLDEPTGRGFGSLRHEWKSDLVDVRNVVRSNVSGPATN